MNPFSPTTLPLQRWADGIWPFLTNADRASLKASCKAVSLLCDGLMQLLTFTGECTEEAGGHAIAFIARLPTSNFPALHVKTTAKNLQPWLDALADLDSTAATRVRELCVMVTKEGWCAVPAKDVYSTEAIAHALHRLFRRLPNLITAKLELPSFPHSLGLCLTSFNTRLEHLRLKHTVHSNGSDNNVLENSETILQDIMGLHYLSSLELMCSGEAARYSPASQRCLELVAGLPSLQHLAWGAGFRHTNLEALRRLSRLTSLHLAGSGRDFYSPEAPLAASYAPDLGSLTTLEQLRLPGTRLDRAIWVGALARLPRLQTLTILPGVLIGAGRPPLPPLARLTSLDLTPRDEAEHCSTYMRSAQSLLAAVAALPSLQRINFSLVISSLGYAIRHRLNDTRMLREEARRDGRQGRCGQEGEGEDDAEEEEEEEFDDPYGRGRHAPCARWQQLIALDRELRRLPAGGVHNTLLLQTNSLRRLPPARLAAASAAAAGAGAGPNPGPHSAATGRGGVAVAVKKEVEEGVQEAAEREPQPYCFQRLGRSSLELKPLDLLFDAGEDDEWEAEISGGGAALAQLLNQCFPHSEVLMLQAVGFNYLEDDVVVREELAGDGGGGKRDWVVWRLDRKCEAAMLRWLPVVGERWRREVYLHRCVGMLSAEALHTLAVRLAVAGAGARGGSAIRLMSCGVGDDGREELEERKEERPGVIIYYDSDDD